MLRVLTFIAAGLCVTPACFWAGMFLVTALKPQGGDSDKTIANAHLAVPAGALCAVAGFLLTAFLACRRTPPSGLKYLHLAVAVVVVATRVVWSVATAGTPALRTLEGQYAALEIEVRAASSILDGRPIGEEVTCSFEGDGDTTSDENRARQEGEFAVLAAEIYPRRTRTKEWAITVFLRDPPRDSIWFTLGLPPQPQKEVDWPPWISPSAEEGYVAPAGLTLRYRLRFARYGAVDERSLARQRPAA